MDDIETIATVADVLPENVTPDMAHGVGNLIARLNDEDWTPGQRSYLLTRISAGSTADACRMARIQASTVEKWRSYPRFKAIEREIRALSTDTAVQVARAIFQRAAPIVAIRQVEQAAEDHTDLTDRQLMAQQRARDAVLKAAGLDQPPPPSAGTSIDEMALVLFRRIRTPALPSPSDS